MTHELKCWPGPFDAIRSGVKRFEFRSEADRRFAVGDTLDLREWSPDCGYTDNRLAVLVTYLLRGPAFGIPFGFVCMSIEAMP